MPKQVTQYELLISCPSDVKTELDIIKETVENFNRMYGAANNATIIIKHWSTDSYPEAGGHPQKLLNNQFVLNCDAAVAVFWTRFGTPTDEYGSGTEEEIEELVKSGKQVFLYFSDCPLNPSNFNNEQYQKVVSFRDKYKDKGIYGTYSSLDDFRKNFLNHLSLYFVGLLTNEDVSLKTVGSKLSLKGVINGKPVEKPKVFKSQYSKSQFTSEMSNKIADMFKEIEELVMPEKIVEVIESTPKESAIVKSEIANKIGEFALAWTEQIKGLASVFPNSQVSVNNEIRELIISYAKDNGIDINPDKFFNIGDLVKQHQPVGGGLYGMSPSYQLVGSDDEKKKYKLIKQLWQKIDKYMQYIEYFSKLDSKYYIDLVLSNLGTKYDEDVDVKIIIKQGLLCKKDQLPVPGDDILEDVNSAFEIFFKPQKTVAIVEYDDYPVTPNLPPLIYSHFLQISSLFTVFHFQFV